MADTQTFKQQTFSTENDQVEGYRRLSHLAVWSIPLGLASALAMVSPLLWFVPVLAIAIATGGLVVISRSNDTTGRRLALIGLGLAVLFGTWGVAWTISRRNVIHGQARTHASEWLVLMQQQDYMKAHQLSIDFFERLPANASLEEHYRERSAQLGTTTGGRPEIMPGLEQTPATELKSFKEIGVPKILVEAQGEFQFEFVKSMAIVRDDQFTTKVDQIFHLTFADDHEPREIDIKMELKRTVDGRKAHWQIGPVSELKPAG